MNSAKEEIEKLVLLLLVLLAGLYLYVHMLLAPLGVQERNHLKAIQDLTPKIEAAKNQISTTRALESKVPEATKEMAFITENNPKGAPLAWFPPRLNQFLSERAIPKAVVRLVDEPADSDLAGFRQFKWKVELPATDVMTLGKAMAALENQEVLLEVSSLQIEVFAQEPLRQRAVLNLTTWIKQ